MSNEQDAATREGRGEHLARMLMITGGGLLRTGIMGVVIGSIIVVALNHYVATTAALSAPQSCLAVIAIAMLAVVTYLLVFGIPTLFLKHQAKSFDVSDIQQKSEELQEKIDQDFFNNLVKINFKYIDKYYLQTQLQADKAFYTALGAGIVGLAITIGGIIMMFTGKVAASYVTTGAGMISQFIAAVFFYLYNRTVMRMAEYHRKLVLTQNIGLALRITQDLPHDCRTGAQTQLIERLTMDINQLLAFEHPVAPVAAASS
jgi:MFS family permease